MERRSVDLAADCSRCVGLCCVAPSFSRSVDFALDKPGGAPCPNLADDHRCTIHDRLRVEGFAGCVAYDCFGAGQRVTQETFGGVADWRDGPEIAVTMFGAFAIVRSLHELLRHLDEALGLAEDPPLEATLREMVEEIDGAARLDLGPLADVDLDRLRAMVAPLLRQVSGAARAGLPASSIDLSGADLTGADLRGRQLRGADLRGALLLGADLRHADLARACLLGADLRGARVHGADLRGAIFLTGPQVASASGDRTTILSSSMTAPAHW